MMVVAGAVARGLCVKAIFLFFCFFCPCRGGVGWGKNVHVVFFSVLARLHIYAVLR